jgi:serine/threonine-protein kinase
MSVVYKGLDTSLDREVAVKVLHPHLANKVESRKRLEREAKAVARLKHPNILEVYDYAGAEAEEAFIVTEYIRGKTLRQFITDEALQPPEIAAMVLHEVAQALAHAHEAGVLHRDLKPENVMVREDGALKLMDFGIAKILDRDEKMTMTGALVGSPAHMAPEIIEGEEAGAEADVFSLGTMLYLFSTGRLPFTAPNTTATLKRILDCVYDDPRQVVPTVSDELAEIIGTCLQRAPAARYPNAGKLRDALGAMLTELGLTRPHEELQAFFLDPRGYRKALGPRLTTTLNERAERLLAEKKQARALSALNQVLALDPANTRAQALLGQMKARRAREQRVKRLTRLSWVAGGAFILAMGALRGVALATQAPEPRLEVAHAPHELVLANVAWQRPAPVAPASAPVTAPEPVAELRPVAMPVHPPPRPGLPPALKTQLVDVKVVVRPFGYLQVDHGARTVEALQLHELKLAPGPHQLTVSCDACESAGASSAVTVDGALDRPITLIAPLKPSLVSFDGYPADAVVRVGAEQRTVAESRVTPFRVVTPPEGSREMRHEVRYEIISPAGQVLDRGTRKVAPGQALVIGGPP